MTKKHSHFSLHPEAKAAYQQWRDWKLSVYPKEVRGLVVPIADPFDLTNEEKLNLQQNFIRANMAVYSIKYRTDFTDKNIVKTLGQDFGLNRLDNNLCADSDGITSLQVIDGGRKQGYIPYSNLKISWHTDGYYNLPEEEIRGLILHCANTAVEGGENEILDHEMMYIHLREKDPAYISALMKTDVLTIPANIENGVEIRGAQSGPVFSIDSTGALHMRYSARKRNIIWADDEITTKAVDEINDFLASDSPWIFHHRLEPGQGLICNNVLHNRTSFNNGKDAEQQRLMFRGRYYDRLVNTSYNDTARTMSL